MLENQIEPVRLILTYDVDNENLDSYYQFVLGTYLPFLEKNGLRILDAWSVSYGDAPNRQIGFIAEDQELVFNLIDGLEWPEMNDKLYEYVTDFDYKLVKYREGYQF